MRVWTLAAILAVSCAASAAGGWAARGLSTQDRPTLVATPRIIEKCEKGMADIILRRDIDGLNEGSKREYAIITQECYEYGLVTDRYLDAIKNSQIGPYLEQYGADPNVWRLKPA